jgi:hypothetical protein
MSSHVLTLNHQECGVQSGEAMRGRLRGSSEQAVLTIIVASHLRYHPTKASLQFEMQRDTNRTFREIHGSEETFLAAVEEIENIGLVVRIDDEPLRLRFLIPHPTLKTKINSALTPADEHKPGQPYIAVSYTWAYKHPCTDSDPYQITRYGIFGIRDVLHARYDAQSGVSPSNALRFGV